MAAALKTAAGWAHLRMAEKRLTQRLARAMQPYGDVAGAQPEITGDHSVRLSEEIGAPQQVREFRLERGQMRGR